MANDATSFDWSIGLIDNMTEPAKKISKGWKKMTDAVVAQNERIKGGVKELRYDFKMFGRNVRDTGRQLKAFGGIAKSVVGLLGVGAIAGA